LAVFLFLNTQYNQNHNPIGPEIEKNNEDITTSLKALCSLLAVGQELLPAIPNSPDWGTARGRGRDCFSNPSISLGDLF
jgi:hypothetical protein